MLTESHIQTVDAPRAPIVARASIPIMQFDVAMATRRKYVAMWLCMYIVGSISCHFLVVLGTWA